MPTAATLRSMSPPATGTCSRTTHAQTSSFSVIVKVDFLCLLPSALPSPPSSLLPLPSSLLPLPSSLLPLPSSILPLPSCLLHLRSSPGFHPSTSPSLPDYLTPPPYSTRTRGGRAQALHPCPRTKSRCLRANGQLTSSSSRFRIMPNSCACMLQGGSASGKERLWETAVR